MRPIKLTMTAFGPYKDREIVDFTKLDENRLFVISGKTGAGKTTIFDGICFALYGSASGEDRQDYKILRSDFADDELHTSVELVFELNHQKYRILRQLGHVKKGNKTATGEKYEFYRVDETGEVPCVDRQMKSEIDQCVEEIVGLTKDQFSQIVMLPQGEFRKLLTSKTENKEEILRRIFQTYPYQEITEQLNAKRKEAEEAFSQIEQLRNQYVAEIKSKLPEREDSKLTNVLSQEHFNMNQLVDALETEAEYYREYVELMQKQKGLAQERVKKMQEHFQKAKTLNEKFDELSHFEQKQTELKTREDHIQNQQILLEKSVRASQIEVHESHVKDIRQDVENQRRAKTDADHALVTANEALKKAEGQYQTEEGRKDEREQAGQLVEKLKELRPKVEELNAKKKVVDEHESAMKELDARYNSIESYLQQQQQEKEKLNTYVREVTEAVDQLPQKQQALNLLHEKWREANRYIQMIGERDILKKKLTVEERTYKQAKDDFEKMEQAWIHGQAGILAEHLHDGEPCPVCGSMDHPKKAELAVETPSKAELDEAKARYDEMYQSYTGIVARYKAKQDQMQEKEDVLKSYDLDPETINQTFDWLVEQGQNLKHEVDHLNRISKELKSKREELDKLTEQIKQVEKDKDNLRKQFDEKKLEYERAKVTYEGLLDSVPEQVREPGALDRKLKDAEATKTNLDEAWEKAQKQLNTAREEYGKATTHVRNASHYLQEAKAKLEKAEQTFIQALADGGFSNENDYRNAKRTEEERQAMKDTIETFKQQLANVQSRISELREQLLEQERVDLTAYETKVNEAQAQYETALQQYNTAVQNQTDVADLKRRIIETSARVDEQENVLNRIQDLYDVIRGQNSQKISFERYLQIEYLEQIVDAANVRLKRLSNGQFYLKRSDRQEARGRQSGLGLDVYDVYTGQDRDVKTLSGGEKFNASLCLALGMSDVIQSFQGGVSIETMFIDEGFGSLDDESLNKAIDTLIDLQKSGRMIGVISHVQELKTAIPAVLEVNKSRDGYSETQFVLK
ncbi:AAA family ATPase [Piscibacillus halophilus]|uniref:Nuclease SbcCD subunit C n=1 Tax=Piscibacillus halophilus TaxID=571933 RepID=A0A1H9DIZ3_9BACI|nr:SMC family ATPase [Piscibacillus halophilus]SEQ13434.1 exonuclease SbcC [Piscibacillus halophilus]